MRRQAGFTLLEMMIVVIIIAILSAIAIPTYRKYVLRSHRTEAQRALLDLAGRQERYFYAQNKYATKLVDLNGTTTMAGNGDNYVIVDPISASSTDYSMTATAIGNQLRDDVDCKSLTINRVGVQTAVPAANASLCWGK
jgi:type IV pilus assembly protein PilE